VNVLFTPIRVVCQNTLNIALSGADKIAKVRHTLNLGLKVEEVRERLGIINAQYGIFEQAAQKLAATQLTRDAWEGYLKKLSLAPKSNEEKSTRLENIQDQLTVLFERGKGAELPGVKGTAWGAFNAVAEYVDHYRSTKGDEADSRAKSLLFGSGREIKQKAWDEALVLSK
jgi:phage/plasmid-like protein (TIGR03299 family)